MSNLILPTPHGIHIVVCPAERRPSVPGSPDQAQMAALCLSSSITTRRQPHPVQGRPIVLLPHCSKRRRTSPQPHTSCWMIGFFELSSEARRQWSWRPEVMASASLLSAMAVWASTSLFLWTAVRQGWASHRDTRRGGKGARATDWCRCR